MSQPMTVEQVTNRVWGIFTSLDRTLATDDGGRRALLKAHIASLGERGEHNADKLTVDGLVYMKGITSHTTIPPARSPGASR
jgi:hypothetical protein